MYLFCVIGFLITKNRFLLMYSVDTNMTLAVQCWYKYDTGCTVLMQISFLLYSVDANIIFVQYFDKNIIFCTVLMQIFLLNSVDANIIFALQCWCKYNICCAVLMQILFFLYSFDTNIINVQFWYKYIFCWEQNILNNKFILNS